MAIEQGYPEGPYGLVLWAFENAWRVAQEKSETSDANFDKALTVGGSAPTVSPTPFAFVPNVVEPSVNIPSQAEGATLAKFYELSEAVIAQLAGLFRDYMDTYFPDETPYLEKAQEWIVNQLTNGGSGVNAAVEAQIWQRDRARILKEAERLEEEAVTRWAARRYPLPPGAATHQVLQIRRAAYDQLGESSRGVAIKTFETEVQQTQFAVQQALDLYAKAMAAAIDYVKALSVGPQSGMQVVPSVTDSQARLISAANEYYRSRISVEELRMKALMPSAEWDQQSRVKNADLVMQDIKNRIDAAVAAAQSTGTQAAAALNSLHGQAGVSGQSSTQVGYSYGGDVTADVPPKTVA